MPKQIVEMMSQVQAQMQTLPTWVNLWVNWMIITFLCSIFFLKKHRMARVVFVAFLLTIPIAMTVFHLTKSVHLFGIAHLIVWLPLLIYLLKNKIPNGGFCLKNKFDLWLILLLLTISISLPFDVRDIFLVMMGRK